MAEDIQRPLKQAILKRILTNYSTSVAPTMGMQPKTVVSMSFIPNAILDLDEAYQRFTFSASIYFKWTDPVLAWNLSEFPSVRHLYVNPGDVWAPQIIITNGAEKISNIPLHLQLKITNSGVVTGLISDIFKTTCSIDITQYPFDTQTCELGIVASFGFTLVPYAVHNSKSLRDYFIGSSEWDMVNITFQERAPLSELKNKKKIIIAFTLIRHSTSYTLNVIFPLTLLSFMNAFVFLLPVESGEKISYLVSIFVSESVFLNFVNDALPKSSSVPLLTYYMVSILLGSFLALMSTVVVLNLHYHPNKGRGICCKKNSIHSLSAECEDATYVMARRDAADKLKKAANTITGVADENYDKRDVFARKTDFFLFGIFFTMAVVSVAWLFGSLVNW